MARRIGLLLIVLFCAVAMVNALTKGGDFSDFLDGARRLLGHRALYADSAVGAGLIGPPFQAVFFAPFALLAAASPTAARVAWCALSLFCAWAGMVWWASALRRSDAGRDRAWLQIVHPPLVWPVIAILLPLQTNFEHQNMNPLLLALTGGAALMLRRGRPVYCGLLLGTATALKAFPALLLVWLAVATMWTAVAAGIGAAAILTLVSMAWSTPAGWLTDVQRWLQLSLSGGWPVRSNNQSLIAALARLVGADEGGLLPASMGVASPVRLAALVIALTIMATLVVWHRRRHLPQHVSDELAIALMASVLISPIAWDHYWVLAFPAFLFIERQSRATGTPGHRGRVLFWAAVLLTSGLSPITLGSRLYELTRAASMKTIAGLILVIAPLVVERRGIAAEHRTVANHSANRWPRRLASQPPAKHDDHSRQ